MSDPVTTTLITGFLTTVTTFVSLAAFVGRRVDRLHEEIVRLDEKLDRKFDLLMLELLRHVREGHPPNAAA